MTTYTGTNNSETINISSWGPPSTQHYVDALGGNDTVYGSAYRDTITGGSGNDTLYGNAGNDFITGQTGSDNLYGGDGNDSLFGGGADSGYDLLDGGAGADLMSGGAGNDTYVHDLNCGVDTINDGLTETLASGYGGGVDTVKMMYVTDALQLVGFHDIGSNDLRLTSVGDMADGSMDDGVILKDFYLQDPNTFIEYVKVGNGTTSDLWLMFSGI